MMGLMKGLLIDISNIIGLEGEITKDIICIGERVLENHGRKNKHKKALETMRIARQIRELRGEISAEREKNKWVDMCAHGVNVISMT